MDGLSAAVSITARVDISANIASFRFQNAIAVKDEKEDADRFRKTITKIKNVFGDVKQLHNG